MRNSVARDKWTLPGIPARSKASARSSRDTTYIAAEPKRCPSTSGNDSRIHSKPGAFEVFSNGSTTAVLAIAGGLVRTWAATCDTATTASMNANVRQYRIKSSRLYPLQFCIFSDTRGGHSYRQPSNSAPLGKPPLYD